MASDTYQRAKQIADQLLVDGIKPTQQQVRSALGKGSISTINKALNDWWKELGERLNKKSQLPDIPEKLTGIVTSLWEVAVTEARHQHDDALLAAEARTRAAKSALTQSIQSAADDKSELLQRLEVAMGNAAELQARVAELDREVAALERRTLEAEKRQHELQRDNRTLEATLAGVEAQLEEARVLKRENSNLRRALEQLDRARQSPD